MSSDIENSVLFTIRSVVIIAPKEHRTYPQGSQSRGTSEYVSKYASQSGEALDVLKRLLEEMNSYRIGTPEDV